MNDNAIDLPESIKEAIRKAYAAGRVGGLKEGVDLIASFGNSADTQSVMNACVVMSGALVRKIDEQPDFPEYMR